MISSRLVKPVTLLFLLVGFAFTSTSALSYWKEVTVPLDIELVTIGEPVEVVIEDLNKDREIKYLVPSGYILTTDETDQIVLEYEVGVSKELLNVVDLHINVEDILVDGDSIYSHLVNITVMGSSDEVILDLYNSTILITIVIQLEEPIDLEEANERNLDINLVNVQDSVQAYEDLFGKDIMFTLSFKLQTKEQFNEEETT